MNNIYISNLTDSVTEDQLFELISEFGTVNSIKIIDDIFTGCSKGFGFIEMSTDEDAEAVVKSLDGSFFQGHIIKLKKIIELEETEDVIIDDSDIVAVLSS